jgi:hypothetical protein
VITGNITVKYSERITVHLPPSPKSGTANGMMLPQNAAMRKIFQRIPLRIKDSQGW